MNESKNNEHSSADQSWFERNVNLIIILLSIACLLSLGAQAVLPMFDEHHPPHFPNLEEVFGFQALFGFIAFVVVVFLGVCLRKVIKRPEDYYDA